ncbi:uncharacterized protein BX664DRAFT_367023 [Halteromyces radiatus]|uniref:uncharacterized protein n=1 Tax=Halteromyces radiatus TaxID=101107 RepID=UPI002220F79E|nr:uncharacterized protein BX664DRAFT_367023 [Halteromyces radiatus]KAI8079853.1 hypothetical protein BX664DRAFT_367023 [Halteromyces radiatus]
MSSSLPPVPPSYYENFLESLAQIVSKLLTDRETEAVLTSIRSFQERLKRLSSQNLSRLNLELTQAQVKQRHYKCQHEGKTCTQNCTRGFIKAYTVAFVVKYLIGVLPLLLTGKLFKKPSMLKRMAGNTFLSSYKGILCGMRRLRGTKEGGSDRLNAFVAGTIAGLSLMIDPDKRRRQSMMLYLLTRSLQFSGAWLMTQWSKSRQQRRQQAFNRLKEQVDAKGFEQDEPRQLTLHRSFEDILAKGLEHYAGALVMMLANAQIIYAFLFDRDTLPKSYFAFLLTHAGWKGDFGNMALPLVSSICDTVTRMDVDPTSLPHRIPTDTTTREYISQHVSPNVATIIPHNIRHSFTLCALQHPLDDSCTRSKFTLFRDEYGRALKLYVPLNVSNHCLPKILEICHTIVFIFGNVCHYGFCNTLCCTSFHRKRKSMDLLFTRFGGW